jgi:hypothetical protein
MRPKIGQIVLIDPEDKLKLRDKESTVGTVLKVERNQSTILVQMNPEKKIVIPNKYLYAIQMDERNPPYVIVERSYPRVRFSENDVNKLGTVFDLLDVMSQRLEHYIRSDQEKHEMLDVTSFAKSNVLYIMSKVKRFIAGEMETGARDVFIDRFHKYATDDEDPRDIKPDITNSKVDLVPEDASKDIAMEIAKNIMKAGMSEDIVNFDEDTVLNAEIVEWYKEASTGNEERDELITKQFECKTMQTAVDIFNKNATIEELFKDRCEYLVGSEHIMRNLIASMYMLIKSSTKEIINIPILIVMDPTCLIEILIKRHPTKILTYSDIISAIIEAGSVKALLANERLDLPHVVKSIAVPIFPFRKITPSDIMKEVKDVITSVCVEISNHTDIEVLDDETIEDVGLDDVFTLHLPITLTNMSIKPFEGGAYNE